MEIKILKQRARAFDHLFDAVVVTDLQGIITDWNKGSETLYGYSREEAIGQPVNILHVPEDSSQITSEVISAVEKFGKWCGEIRMRHKAGHIGWVESMCVPILDDDDRMIGALGINRDITDRVKETERLSHLAHYDQLTNIPNRYLLLDRLSHLIKQSQRNAKTFSLLYIDLDNFKAINDARGHAFGDQVLIETARRLTHAIRDSDTVARIGGDEFVLLLENTASRDDLSAMAKTLIRTISSPYIIQGEAFEVSCSIGIATYPDEGATTDALLAVADKAMYKAKHKGRGNYEF